MSILYVSGSTVRSVSADGSGIVEFSDPTIATVTDLDYNVREGHKGAQQVVPGTAEPVQKTPGPSFCYKQRNRRRKSHPKPNAPVARSTGMTVVTAAPVGCGGKGTWITKHGNRYDRKKLAAMAIARSAAARPIISLASAHGWMTLSL
ncbi:Vitellogenin receptor [Operophtera brumata]|uniref:Vitellogenin receptor n=1 Tax=Operophtera brumata TaxID=104452 RepID=A0A0L7KZ80_OPEBR|nr:Vitellogenin receptor [Operophtera brumata]